MPASWAQVDAQFPTFAGNETAAEKIGALQSYMFVLTEQLKYNLRNLDKSNWNKDALAELNEENAGPVIEAIEALAHQVSAAAAEASAVSGRVTALTGRMTEAENDIEAASARLSALAESGLVTGEMLSTAGGATIAPENIQPGELNGIDVEGGLSLPQGKEIELLDENGDAIGTLSADEVKLILTAGAALGMMLQAGGSVEITSGGDITITGTSIDLVGTVKVNGTEIAGGV